MVGGMSWGSLPRGGRRICAFRCVGGRLCKQEVGRGGGEESSGGGRTTPQGVSGTGHRRPHVVGQDAVRGYTTHSFRLASIQSMYQRAILRGLDRDSMCGRVWQDAGSVGRGRESVRKMRKVKGCRVLWLDVVRYSGHRHACVPSAGHVPACCVARWPCWVYLV